MTNTDPRHMGDCERDTWAGDCPCNAVQQGNGKPPWLLTQLRDRHMCQQCADRTATTEWAGTGELLCWTCCEKRQAAYHERNGN